MKASPLQLSSISYSRLEFWANPDATEEQVGLPLAVIAEGRIRYEADGDHFAGISIRTQETNAYSLSVEAFATFRIDIEGCRETYKQGFNPAVIGVNVVRLLYSSCREFVSTITSRAPYGTASLPSLVLEPSDVSLRFEEGCRDRILADFFGYSQEQLEELREAIRKHTDAKVDGKKRRKAKKVPHQAKTPAASP